MSRMDRGRDRTSTVADGRAKLLDRVGSTLLEGLRVARATEPWLDLPWRARPDLAPPDSGGSTGGDGGTNFASLWDAYEASGGTLVLVGEEGSGKTMASLELISVAHEHASGDPSAPVPVLLDLVEWRIDRGIEDWVLDGLRVHYGIPIRFGAEMLDRGRILVVADSLDATAGPERSTCSQQITALAVERPGLRIVVACRTEPYLRLESRFPGLVVEIATPTPGQLAEYAGASGLQHGPQARRDGGAFPPNPGALRLLVLAGGFHATTHDLDLDRAALAARAIRRWFIGPPDRRAGEQLARFLATEFQGRFWWAGSLGRIAAVGPTDPDLRRAQRRLVVGATTVLGLVAGLVAGATLIVASATVPGPRGNAMIVGIALGTVAAVADGLVVDAGLAGDPESNPRRASRSDARRVAVRVLAVVGAEAVMLGLWTVAGDLAAPGFAGAALGALVGARSQQVPWRDSVRWSWRSFRHKLLVRLGVALAAAPVLTRLLEPRAGALATVGFATGLAVTGALVAGSKRRIADPPVVTTRRRSLPRRSFIRGLAITLVAGLVTGILASTIEAESAVGAAAWVETGLAGALVAGVAAATLALALYGGLEWLERSTLNAVLVRAGVVRAPVSEALDRLVGGTLLRPAGMGATFAHRSMSEVLAAPPDRAAKGPAASDAV
jgi:hypothetical protein